MLQLGQLKSYSYLKVKNIFFNENNIKLVLSMCVSRRGTGCPDPPLKKNHENMEFLSITGPDPVIN